MSRRGGDDIAHALSDKLNLLLIGWMHCGPGAKCELLLLASFAVCTFASATTFPLNLNLALALLGARSRRPHRHTRAAAARHAPHRTPTARPNPRPPVHTHLHRHLHLCTISARTPSGLGACRPHGSEAQRVFFCSACVWTSLTDLMFMLAHPSAWGGALIIFNLLLK